MIFQRHGFLSLRKIQCNVDCELRTECFGKGPVKFTGLLSRPLNTERSLGPGPRELWGFRYQRHEGLSGLGEKKSSVITLPILAAWGIATGNNFYPGLEAPVIIP